MSFVHNDDDFVSLLRIVAEKNSFPAALAEKDYWVTHTLWALHETGLDIWFKGGTSLSKGFALIHRFSEDLDLMIQRGSMEALPEVTNWTSTNKGRVSQRKDFYEALVDALVVPDIAITMDAVERHARGAEYLGHYPGVLLDELAPAMSPIVRLEVGCARVVPYVEIPLSSFVHDYLDQNEMLASYTDNRPKAVRCVHPMVTLIEKLDAMSRRYGRGTIEAATFVRHYEDAAQIVQASAHLPNLGMTVEELAKDMLAKKDISAIPTKDEPALQLDDAEKRQAVEDAYEKIGPMFWGPRIALDAACSLIREWLEKIFGARDAAASSETVPR